MDLTWVGHVLLMCCDEYFSETDLHSKNGRLGGMGRGETFDKRRKEIESYHIRVVANRMTTAVHNAGCNINILQLQWLH